MDFFADDSVLEMPRGPHPWGQRYIGMDKVREGIATRFAGVADVQYGKDRHFVSGDMGISEWTVVRTAPGGSRLEVHDTDHLEFRDGKGVKRDSHWKLSSSSRFHCFQLVFSCAPRAS